MKGKQNDGQQHNSPREHDRHRRMAAHHIHGHTRIPRTRRRTPRTITAKIIGYFIDHGAHGERIDLRDIYRSMGDDERTSTDMALAMLEETHVIDTHDE